VLYEYTHSTLVTSSRVIYLYPSSIDADTFETETRAPVTPRLLAALFQVTSPERSLT